jgi:hypothetical protein
MPTEVAASPSARPWKASAGHEALWKRIIQSAAEPDFLIVLLFSIIGLVLSLFLAVSLNIPQADTLLMMPG